MEIVTLQAGHKLIVGGIFRGRRPGRTVFLFAALNPRGARFTPWERGSAVLSFKAIEEVCESKNITLVVHPAVRRAIGGYEESFYIGLRCFLKDESDGFYFLPLEDGGYVRLCFSQRKSAGGYPILRVDPISQEVLQRIKSTSA